MTGPVERVLFVVPVEPWCRESGSNLIMADLLEGLSRSTAAEILPIFLRKGPVGYTAEPADDLETVTLGVEGLPKWISLGRAVLQGSSPVQTRFANDRVARQVRAAAEERGFAPTLVHVEHLPLVGIGRLLASWLDCPLVYRAHNIESLLWARRMGLPGALGRFVGSRMGRAEARAMESCDLTLCISEVDLAWARTHAPRASTELFPCSLLVERYDKIERARTDSAPQICFVGGLEWGPNEVGLRWFVDEALPLIVRESPDARLAVLARGASSREWLTGNPAVQILPPETHARVLFASSDVSIAPLLQGGGVRIKIPESLALGCPVVATSIGAEGLDLPGLTRTDDPAEFARGCLEHLRGTVDPAARRKTLRDSVEATHGAVVLGRQLIELWAGVGRGDSGSA